MIKKFIVILLIVLSVFGFTQNIHEEKAEAADASRFNPGRIIDDRIFTDTSAMNVNQIQHFLNTVNGTGSTCLKNYVTDKPLGGNAYGGPVSAAQAISDVSNIFGLNPRVILVTLQKEQSLITSTNCSASKYRSAMGFGCPDTAPCDAQWYGLSKQLYQGARHLKGFYNNSLTYVPFKIGTYYIGWHPNGACGGTNVNIQTRGTAALYSYTPYQPNSGALGNLYGTGNSCSSYGNRNFWRDFSDWFGSPTGDLVRTMSSKTVYLLGENIKYPIREESVFYDFIRLGPVNYVDNSALDAIPTGSTLNRMVGSTGGPKLYLISEGMKFPFISCDQVVDYGFTCGEPINRLTPGQLSLFATAPDLTSLMRSSASPTVYYIKEGKKRVLPTWQDITQLGEGYAVNWLDPDYVNAVPTGDVLVTGGGLIKSPDSSRVYAVNDWENDPSAFPVLNFSYTIDLGLGATVKTLSAAQMSKYDIEPNIYTKVKCDASYYLGSSGSLYQFDPSLFSHFGYNTSSFVTGGDICNRFRINPSNMSRFIINRGKIYYIENGTKRWFMSYPSYVAYGGHSNPLIPVSDTYLASIPSGNGINA